jgi:hypothetical protein
MQIKFNDKLAKDIRCVFVDGVDVTKRCFYIDTDAGEAHCFKTDGNNKFYIDPETDGAAKEILHGKVEVIFKEGLN